VISYRKETSTVPASTPSGTAVSFGIATPPQQVSYDDIRRVWLEADTIPQIGHAWVFDHYFPIAGDPEGPIFDGWTLLAALAGQTSRLRLGLMVTSNRFRPPSMLAKIATTVDIVSGGRLEFGIGAGSRPEIPTARREYDANGLPYWDAKTAVAALAEACVIIRRLWTEDKPFDFHGEHYNLTGAYNSPKPVQRPGPPIVIGGRAGSTLRVAAEHADVVNIPGAPQDAAERSALLTRYCEEIGRDPAAITRSTVVPVSYGNPGAARETARQAVSLGFTHLVLSAPAPWPDGLAAWLAEQVIDPLH
jgi:alkanesulfonate monooxygenase SsuD/methylene tetrahydromethanopterin reductase-like flavin-dependent oxidoreductase (luciferase family)